MKNLSFRQPMKTQTKVLAGIFITIILLAGLLYTFKIVNSWFNTHYFEFAQPVEVKLNQPIAIKERKPIVQKIVLDYPDEIDTPIEKYIVEKFGVWDAKTALAIAKAESGFREEAIHINTNNTIDVGIFQINSVHFKKAGCSLKELVDQYKNVDCAYSIYKEQGFTPWVAFINKSYLVNL